MAKRRHAPISTDSVSSSCDYWGRAPSNRTCFSKAAWMLDFKKCPQQLGNQVSLTKSFRMGFATSHGRSQPNRGGPIYFLLCQKCFRHVSSLITDWLHWLAQRLNSAVYRKDNQAWASVLDNLSYDPKSDKEWNNDKRLMFKGLFLSDLQRKNSSIHVHSKSWG